MDTFEKSKKQGRIRKMVFAVYVNQVYFVWCSSENIDHGYFKTQNSERQNGQHGRSKTEF